MSDLKKIFSAAMVMSGVLASGCGKNSLSPDEQNIVRIFNQVDSCSANLINNISLEQTNELFEMADTVANERKVPIDRKNPDYSKIVFDLLAHEAQTQCLIDMKVDTSAYAQKVRDIRKKYGDQIFDPK